MASFSRYSPSELLRLRGSQSSRVLLLKAKSDPEINEIINGQPHQHSYARRGRRARDNVLSSGDRDDEVSLYGSVRRPHTSSAPEGQTEWGYQRQVTTEQATDQPVPAPPGHVNQQNAGFLRFYNAVSSPNHLRVTAGGKLVPNTRASTSPTHQWGGERLPTKQHPVSEDQQSYGNANIQMAEHTVPTAAPMNMGAPIPAPFLPAFMPMYHPAPVPFSLMTMPNGMQVPVGMAPFGYQQHPLTAPNGVPNTASASLSVNESDGTNAKVTERASTTRKPKPAPIMISPPEQFDQTRPYMYVWQPAVQGQPSAHIAPLTSPIYAPSLHRAIPVQTGFGGPVAMPHSAPAGASFSRAMGRESSSSTNDTVMPTTSGDQSRIFADSPNSSSNHRVGGVRPGLDIPVTSIKPSEITKNQLNSLRQSLKYYEDQLQYNKHQIDEQQTQAQIAQLRSNIEHFGTTYKLQRDYEAGFGVRSQADNDAQSPETVVCQTPSRPSLEVLAEHDGKSKAEATEKQVKKHPEQTSMPSSAGLVPINFTQERSSGPSMLHNLPRADRPVTRNGNSLVTADGLLAHRWTRDYPASIQVQPYLIGNAPQNPAHYFSEGHVHYNYARELTDEEKRARQLYWGELPSKGLGLPKFDGKDFYAPSPVKRDGISKAGPAMDPPRDPKASNGPPRADNDPFQPTSDTRGGRVRQSRAVPIVNPYTLAREDAATALSTGTLSATDGERGVGAAKNSVRPAEPQRPSVPMNHVRPSQEPRIPDQQRRPDTERASNGILQSMLRRDMPGRIALPGALSSTTASGYLPHSFGHAAASLAPAVANANNSPQTSSPSGPVEKSAESKGLKADKQGENCPP